ncbi:MAG: hypothetical protein Edafosvirus19_9 [Edafosvirus sp.]|uniref:Uncharacterized protein n=1 Tax=Edafosvirus sp. TaxID=2487765 RepID=A0A3G4ZUJ6_9VIRU|nr:MAG: hypothetical protein Edafosvirus19_9 [Edafosvirus sp.]
MTILYAIFSCTSHSDSYNYRDNFKLLGVYKNVPVELLTNKVEPTDNMVEYEDDEEKTIERKEDDIFKYKSLETFEYEYMDKYPSGIDYKVHLKMEKFEVYFDTDILFLDVITHEDSWCCHSHLDYDVIDSWFLTKKHIGSKVMNKIFVCDMKITFPKDIKDIKNHESNITHNDVNLVTEVLNGKTYTMIRENYLNTSDTTEQLNKRLLPKYLQSDEEFKNESAQFVTDYKIQKEIEHKEFLLKMKLEKEATIIHRIYTIEEQLERINLLNHSFDNWHIEVCNKDVLSLLDDELKEKYLKYREEKLLEIKKKQIFEADLRTMVNMQMWLRKYDPDCVISFSDSKFKKAFDEYSEKYKLDEQTRGLDYIRAIALEVGKLLEKPVTITNKKN